MRLLLLLFLFASSACHAFQVTGVVRDLTGNPIPYVSVFAENSTNGVITNFKGQFYLELDSGKYTLVFRHAEYELYKEEIHVVNSKLTLDVKLEPAAQELNAFVISTDKRDPAYAIIQNAIDHKKKYLQQYESYVCSSYTKCSVEKEVTEKDSVTNETLNSKKHKNFIESFSSTYFKQPEQVRQIIHAYNDHVVKTDELTVTIQFGENHGPPTGVPYNKNLFRQNTCDPGFNFYHNLIDLPTLGSTPFISPISRYAMLSYDYHLDETFREDSVFVHKIRVMPKRRESATFSGYIYIEDSTWAIKATDLEINPRALYYFRTFNIQHQYGNVRDSIKILKREEYFYTAKDDGSRVFGNTIMLHSNYIINPDLPNNFFNNEIKTIEDEAYDKDTLYWNSNRPITLRKEEAEFVRYQDSVITYQQSAVYLNEKDSIYNQIKVLDFLLFGVGFRNWSKKQSIYFTPLIGQVRPFGVGGYRHVLSVNYKKEFKKGYAIDTKASADYGFNNKDLKGSLDTRYTYLPKRFGKIHLKIGDTYELLNTYESISAIFSRSNYINRKALIIGHSMEFFNGFYADIDLEYAENHSIADIKLSSWSEQLFGSLNAPKDFETFNEVYLDMHLTYTIKQKYYNEPYKKVIVGSDYPQIELWYKRGIKGALGSIVDFDFAELSIHDEVQIGTLGETRYRVSGGSFFRKENVQLTNYKFFRRSDRGFFSDPLKSFQLLRPPSDTLNGFYPGVIATTNTYLQANYIHHFNGALLNKIPLLNRLKLEAVAGAGVLYVQNNNFRHAEAFVGIERPFLLKGELLKIGVYFVGADSNFSRLDSSLKVGINFFDAFNQKWMY